MKKYYDVERILEKDENNGISLYLVKWLGYPLNEATWEPKSNLLNVKYMIEEFDKSFKKKNLKEPLSTKGEKREDKLKIYKENLEISQNEKEIVNIQKHSIDPDLKNIFFPNPKIDIPLQIIDTLKVDKNVYFEIKWKVRPDGIEPYNTSMTFHQVKENYPHMLLEYLESKNINLY